MFWKVFGFIIRLIYFKRFRQADRIGEAAKMLSEGKAQLALTRVEKEEATLHSSLYSLYYMVHGRILDSLGRVEDAEKSFRAGVEADPSSVNAQFELAVVEGRLFRLDEARSRLEKVVGFEEVSDELKKQAEDILDLLEQVKTGQRTAEFKRRAKTLSEKRVGPENNTLGLPVSLELLDQWIEESPDEAKIECDEIALLIGQSEAKKKGGKWKASLALDESLINGPGGVLFKPFSVVAKRLSTPGSKLQSIIDEAWNR